LAKDPLLEGKGELKLPPVAQAQYHLVNAQNKEHPMNSMESHHSERWKVFKQTRSKLRDRQCPCLLFSFSPQRGIIATREVGETPPPTKEEEEEEEGRSVLSVPCAWPWVIGDPHALLLSLTAQ